MTLLVAEIGINHQGSLRTAKQMAHTALACGADMVKLQMRDPLTCVPKDQWNKPKVTPWGEEMTYIKYRHAMEFNDQQLTEFGDEIGWNNWFPSVFDIPSLERAAAIGARAVKLPSAAFTDKALLSAAIDVAEANKAMLIMSTGMTTLNELEDMAAHANSLGLGNLFPPPFVLHCNSAYPTQDDEINLNAMKALEDIFPDALIGFSSHSTSPYPAIYAAVLGAQMVEVHFTLDRSWPGSDHAASLEPSGLALVARELKRIRKIMGDGVLRMYDSEISARMKLRGH